MGIYNTNALVRLRDTDEDILDPAQDVRGRKVKDSLGQDLGKIKDLLLDQGENKVRALIVDHGHFLEKETSIIPVDAIKLITPTEVVIDQTKDKISGSPAYDPELVYNEDEWVGYYGYYGYAPYWYDGYVYAAYPYYA